MGLRLLGRCKRAGTDRGGAATAFSTGLVAKGAPCRMAYVHLVGQRPAPRTAPSRALYLRLRLAGTVGGGCCAAPWLDWASLARIWRCGMAYVCWWVRGPWPASRPCLAGMVCCLGVQLFVDVVFTFDSTHVAMAADKALAGAGVAFTMIPTPTAISAGCGISLRLSYGLLEQARSVLATQTPPIVSAAHGLDEAGTYTPL